MLCFSFVLFCCLWLTYPESQTTEERQGRNSNKSRTWSQELMESAPWKSAAYCFIPDLLRLLSYRIQDHQPKGGPTYNRLDPPTSIAMNKMPCRHANKCSFSVEVLFSQVVLICVKLISNHLSQASPWGEDCFSTLRCYLLMFQLKSLPRSNIFPSIL